MKCQTPGCQNLASYVLSTWSTPNKVTWLCHNCVKLQWKRPNINITPILFEA